MIAAITLIALAAVLTAAHISAVPAPHHLGWDE